MSPTTDHWRCVSTHPEDIETGRVVAPLEVLTADEFPVGDEHPFNQRLVDDGLFVEAEAPEPDPNAQAEQTPEPAPAPTTAPAKASKAASGSNADTEATS